MTRSQRKQLCLALLGLFELHVGVLQAAVARVHHMRQQPLKESQQTRIGPNESVHLSSFLTLRAQLIGTFSPIESHP